MGGFDAEFTNHQWTETPWLTRQTSAHVLTAHSNRKGPGGGCEECLNISYQHTVNEDGYERTVPRRALGHLKVMIATGRLGDVFANRYQRAVQTSVGV